MIHNYCGACLELECFLLLWIMLSWRIDPLLLIILDRYAVYIPSDNKMPLRFLPLFIDFEMYGYIGGGQSPTNITIHFTFCVFPLDKADLVEIMV